LIRRTHIALYCAQFILTAANLNGGWENIGVANSAQRLFLNKPSKKLFTSVTTLAILVISYDDPGIP